MKWDKHMYLQWLLLLLRVGKILISTTLSPKKVHTISLIQRLRSNLTTWDKVVWSRHQGLWLVVEIRWIMRISKLNHFQSLGMNHTQTTEREILLVDKSRKTSAFSWLDNQRCRCLRMLSGHNCKSDRYEISFRTQGRLHSRMVWLIRSHRPWLTWTFIPKRAA